jgi:hypothetical protein
MGYSARRESRARARRQDELGIFAYEGQNLRLQEGVVVRLKPCPFKAIET